MATAATATATATGIAVAMVVPTETRSVEADAPAALRDEVPRSETAGVLEVMDGNGIFTYFTYLANGSSSNHPIERTSKKVKP